MVFLIIRTILRKIILDYQVPDFVKGVNKKVLNPINAWKNKVYTIKKL